MAEDLDKDPSGVSKTDKTEGEQSEESKEKPSLEKITELVNALQKGYTQTRQEFAQTREDLEKIANSINSQSGAQSGEEEYLTVGKLKTILAEQGIQQEQRKAQADSYIESTLNQLKAEGKISTKEEEDALLTFALKHQQPDLLKAAELFDEIKSAREEAKKEAAKTKVKQEEGSKIGTSSKATTKEQGGVDYAKMKKMDWFSF
jgi:hypothetical protein